jgi:hypothetical protein
MAHPKPLASLSSTLLARKGTARPAMRPQGFGAGFNTGAPLEDLGWNDMGAADSAPSPVPPVLVAREALKIELAREPEPAATIEPPVAVKSVSVATATRIGRESAKQTKGSKAAFTLRLDSERHLRLRLASALTNRSSQNLLCQALDSYLTSMPEVDALIAQLPPAKTASR